MTGRIAGRTIFLMTLPPLLWAANAVVGRLLVDSVPPMTLNFLRWAIAALLLLPFAWRADCSVPCSRSRASRSC